MTGCGIWIAGLVAGTRISGAPELPTILILGVTCLALGALVGFVGAGGAGLLVALLTAGFDVPVHEAIGTAVAAMCIVTVSGAASHFREGNIIPKAGIVIGLAGAVGAVLGANIGQVMPESTLRMASGLALWTLAVMVWIRTQYVEVLVKTTDDGGGPVTPKEIAACLGLGLTGGTASAFFGVGMAPLLQLGMLTLLKMPLRLTVGTTMLTLIFVSTSGAIALAFHGEVNVKYLLVSTLGLSAGSYFGARYTRRAPRQMLRTAVVATPAFAGSLLLFT